MVKKRRQTACACLGAAAAAAWRTANGVNRSHYRLSQSVERGIPNRLCLSAFGTLSRRLWRRSVPFETTDAVSCARVYLPNLNKNNNTRTVILFPSRRYTHILIFCTTRISCLFFINRFPLSKSCRDVRVTRPMHSVRRRRF